MMINDWGIWTALGWNGRAALRGLTAKQLNSMHSGKITPPNTSRWWQRSEPELKISRLERSRSSKQCAHHNSAWHGGTVGTYVLKEAALARRGILLNCDKTRVRPA